VHSLRYNERSPALDRFGEVGWSSAPARQLGTQYSQAKTPMAAVLRTRTLSEIQGFLTALIDAN
jgi:pyruvate/2-oxoglutarate dehydrogenase complex dihydrolipoamide dehydrogenase (E3) component